MSTRKATPIIAALFGLIALLSIASPASAASSFEVNLERDAPTVSRSDERIDYAVRVKNLSAATGVPVSVGEALLCAGKFPIKVWLGIDATHPPETSIQWYRDGAPIPGETGELHVATAADASKPIQCLVRGDNEVASAVQVSLPASVVNPPPATAPPNPSSGTVAAARPTITGTGGGSVENSPFTVKRVCHEPTNWTGSPSWSFQWLLNAEPIPGASGNEYQPVASDEGKILQCRVTGTNAGGSAIGTSNNNQVGSVAGAPRLNGAGQTPQTIPNPTTVTLELPGGSQTYAYQFRDPDSLADKVADDWGCVAVPPTGLEPAKAICASFKSIAPGSSYPPLGVATALGADAPNHAVARVTVTGGGSPEPAEDTDEFDFGPFEEFGIELFEAGVSSAPVANSDPDPGSEPPYTQAGGHPVTGAARIGITRKRRLAPLPKVLTKSKKFVPVEHVRDVVVDTPRGFVGNALAVPKFCPGVEQVAILPAICPQESAVGGIFLRFPDLNYTAAIYSVEPEFGTPAQFAFTDSLGNIFVFSPHLRAEDGYAISLVAAPAPSLNLLDATPVLCGFGLKKVDLANEKGTVTCYLPNESGANELPLVTFPTRCAGAPPQARLSIDSSEHPARFRSDGTPDLTDPRWKSKTFSNQPATGCELVEFEPEMDLVPTTHQADSPSGLDVSLTMPTDGLEEPDGISQANLKRVRVTFPRGMAINAAKADGLGACSASQVQLGTNEPISCPDSSKIGTIEIDTPIIRETLTGAMYIARQGEVDGSTIGLYLVFESKKDGVIIKIPGKVTPDPVTGQLVVSFDENPQDPFSAVRMHFDQGPRSPLIAPPRCGTYAIKAEMVPWTIADLNKPTPEETVTETSTFQVTQGPGGGPCPTGALEPKLSAGTSNPLAAKTSPFLVRLHREDGTDRFTSLKMTTPPGLTAYLKGIPYCPQATIDAISEAEGTGQAQIDHPSCPAGSQIGTVIAGAGAGTNPFYANTGKAYLAPPYKGAPLSIAVVAPAVAGPLDLGNVVVQNAIHVDPETAQITAVSDPIPTIFHGLLLNVRDVRIAIDRPNFTRNPTNCDELRVGAQVGGESGATANLAKRFQVGGCEKLKFEPKLNVRFFGGTKRGGHPSLKGTFVAKDGEANIGRAAVTIPRSEFLDQAHIRTICTRVQFAADACPKGAVYGHATATTPLLDYPVSGPVYLRSSSHKLPDLVVDLKGPDFQPIEAVVVGRIDSIKGQIRTTFETTPDVPVSKFTLSMQGGNKGLLVNSRDICARNYRATVKLEGQNGAPFDTRPAVRNGKCR